ncbi:MAG: hypothetical protein R3E96_12970 [Planctomycetota bacterium]
MSTIESPVVLTWVREERPRARHRTEAEQHGAAVDQVAGSEAVGGELLDVEAELGTHEGRAAPRRRPRTRWWRAAGPRLPLDWAAGLALRRLDCAP